MFRLLEQIAEPASIRKPGLLHNKQTIYFPHWLVITHQWEPIRAIHNKERNYRGLSIGEAKGKREHFSRSSEELCRALDNKPKRIRKKL